MSFNTESKPLLQPIPFWVKSYCLPDLFAGKIGAVLCRQWKNRIKGRDWYDFLWFIQHNTPVHLQHLEKRLRAYSYYSEKQNLDEKQVKEFLNSKIQSLDVQLAKDDISKFIKVQTRLDGWSKDLFHAAVAELQFC